MTRNSKRIIWRKTFRGWNDTIGIDSLFIDACIINDNQWCKWKRLIVTDGEITSWKFKMSINYTAKSPPQSLIFSPETTTLEGARLWRMQEVHHYGWFPPSFPLEDFLRCPTICFTSCTRNQFVYLSHCHPVLLCASHSYSVSCYYFSSSSHATPSCAHEASCITAQKAFAV